MASSSSNVVGVHYRVGKKIGEGSFGVIFEGMNLLNSQQVAIKFVRWNEDPPLPTYRPWTRLMRYAIGTEKERCSPATR
jgi:RIO-like serine/threonine protein kinase